MAYRLYYGSNALFDPYTDNIVYDAKLTAKTNTSDYLDFTVPYGHDLYDSLAVKAETVKLYWDKDCLYVGTIESIETDIQGNLDVTCTGALDWLADSIVRPYSTVEGEQPLTAPTSVDGLFEWYITQHNEHCLDTRKQFSVGENQGALLDDNNYIYRSNESTPTTLDEVQDKIIDELGGYLFVNYEPLTIDLYADVHTTNAQIIDFGVNITDFTSTTDTSEQYTAIRPEGADLYFHLKFSASSNPSEDDMTDTPSAYVGTYVDADSSDSSSPSSYWWRAYGNPGSNGIQGNLSDGTALYLHVAYANSDDGKTDFSTNDDTNRYYIGQYVDYTQADSTLPYKYEWGRYKRSDSDEGSEGPHSCSGPSPLTIENLADGGVDYGNGDFWKTGDVIYSVAGLARYGYREYAYSNTDCTLPSTLQTSACKALNAILSPDLSITVKAVDLSLFMEGYTHLKVGEAVRVRSKFHGIDEYLMVQSIELDLQDPSQSTYELGAEYSTLTGQQSTYLKNLNSNINSALDATSALSDETKAAASEAKDAKTQAAEAKAAADAAVVSNVAQWATTADPATKPAEGDWSADAPDYEAGKYIWLRNVITYGSGDTTTTDGVCITGNTGKGVKGDNAYVHIAYANSEDGKTDFSVDDPVGKSYIGQYSDNLEDDSTDPTKYAWTKIKGEQGKQGVSPTVTTSKSGGTTTIKITDADGTKTATVNDGATGNGIKSVTEHYQVSTSNTTAPTSWQDTVPTMTATNKYLWNYETIAYTDGTTSDSKKRVIGVYGTKGDSGKGVASIVEQYYQSTSATSQTGGSWSGTYPGWADGKYIWTRSVVTYTDGTTTTTTPVCVTGSKGGSGDKGTSITSVDVQYYRSTSATALSGGSWSTTAPTWVNGKYIWTKTVTTYSTGSTSESKPACITGQKGSNGATGTSVSSIVNHYLATSASSGVTTSTSGWTTTVQAVSADKKYLWNYETVNYKNPASSADTTPCIIGAYGDKGDTGAKGDKGDKGDPGDKGDSVTKVAVTYGLSTSNASDGYSSVTSWTTDIPDWETGKYIWQKSVTTIGTTAQAPVYALYGAFNSLASTVDGHTTQIKQQGDSIALKANSADIAEISPNWIKDPSFANGSANTDGWSGSHTWSADGMTCSQRDSCVDSCSIDKAKRVYAGQKLYMTLTADMSGLTDGTSCNLGFRIANADKEWKGWPTPLLGGSTARSANETISTTYAVPSAYDGYYFMPFIQLAANTTTTATGTAVIKHVQITDVTGANSYTDSQIKVSANNITSTVASTYETKTDAATIKTTAKTAASDASAAKTTAATAASDASTAKSNAATAVTTANTASSNASTALTTANTASSKVTQTANALGLTFNDSGSTTGTLIKADSTGIEVGYSSDGSSFASTHTKMGTDAFSIHDKSHNKLASFGTTAVVGQTTGGNVQITSSAVNIRSKTTNMASITSSQAVIGSTSGTNKNVLLNGSKMAFRQGTTEKAAFQTRSYTDSSGSTVSYLDIKSASESMMLYAGTTSSPKSVYLTAPPDSSTGYESDMGLGLLYDDSKTWHAYVATSDGAGNLADWVVAKSISSSETTWSWVKWASGRCECWRCVSLSASTASGNRSFSVALPFTVYYGVPTIVGRKIGCIESWAKYTAIDDNTSLSGYVYCGDTANYASGAYCYVNGRWKK